MNFYPIDLYNCRLPVETPTKKQVSYVESICSVLGSDPPREYTKEAYSKFISEHKSDYDTACIYYEVMYSELMYGVDE